MTNYERDHLNPPNEKEVKTCDCEDCNSTGMVYIIDTDDQQPLKEPCPRCEGKGYLEY